MDSARTQRAARHSGFRRWMSVERALRTASGQVEGDEEAHGFGSGSGGSRKKK